MKYTIIAALILTLGLTACAGTVTAPPEPPKPPPIVQPVPPVVTAPIIPTNPSPVSTKANDACAAYKTLQWAVPLAEQFLGAKKLSPQNQQLLDDAVAIVNAGCYGDDATWKQRAIQVAAELAFLLQQD